MNVRLELLKSSYNVIEEKRNKATNINGISNLKYILEM